MATSDKHSRFHEADEHTVASPGILERVGLMKHAFADLGDGEYAFFPNRRSVWVVNRTNGRMANYNFRVDGIQAVDRSRVARVDLKAFPREDTSYLLSDRNLNNILWVCNVRTGDVQMWRPSRDGVLQPVGPIATSTDLMLRETTGK